MKKHWVLTLMSILVITLMVTGCTQEELGYIVRDDITFQDLGFAVEDGKPRKDLTEKDMLEAMGYPYDQDLASGEYQYSYSMKTSAAVR